MDDIFGKYESGDGGPARIITAAIGLVSVALFGLSAYAFYARYWRWMDCFNELGRCYNPDGSHEVYTTSGGMWALPALVGFAGAMISWYMLRARR